MPDEREVRHYILATAGHVDHGKTALIHALTGTDTDRLPEEKARGITIELGFAHLELQAGFSSFSVGVIDVPGHEDFVRNMIAGVGAIDLALLVVAADDGWMPQTEEHLQILGYLGVRRGVVALTKADLGNIEACSIDIRRQLQNSRFAHAPIVSTSVLDNRGIEQLKTALANELAQFPPPRDFGKPRLFVDRAFVVHGSGTIVTGSLSGGSFSRGENVLVQPQNLTTRIRGLQSHNRALEIAGPRRRLALNLAGLAPGQAARGSTISGAQNGALSHVLDVVLTRSSRLPPGARSIGNGAILNLHFGSTRIAARVQLRDASEFPGNAGERKKGMFETPRRSATAVPGSSADEEAIARLRLAEPVCAFIGDRFILRDASERLTIAGGIVLDLPPRGVKFRSAGQRALLDQRQASPDDLSKLLRTQLARDHFALRLDLLANAPFSEEEIATALGILGASGAIFLDQKFAADSHWWDSRCKMAAELIEAEHLAYPERPGLEVSRLREALQLTNGEFLGALLRALRQSGYEQEGGVLRRANFRPALPPKLQAAGDRVRASMKARPLDPPSRRELATDAAAIQALRFLCESGELVALGQDLVMSADAIATMKTAIQRQLHGGKSATVSELRQATGSTRRVLIPLLEYFDRIGLTRRVGDRRSLR